MAIRTSASDINHMQSMHRELAIYEDISHYNGFLELSVKIGDRTMCLPASREAVKDVAAYLAKYCTQSLEHFEANMAERLRVK